MKAVLALGLQLCLVNVILASLAPRGPRPVENRDRFKSKQCSEREWTICTEDDWGSKCPSGCRLQGLMDVENQKNADKIKDIRQMLQMYSTSFGKTHVIVTEAVNRIRQTLNGLGGSGNIYNQLVESLNIRLTILQNRVNDQILKLNILKNMMIGQFNEVRKLEVDIDMKIRACKGSCKQAFTYNINREQNVQIEKNLRSVASTRLEIIQYGKTERIFKMRPMKDKIMDSRYKSAPITEPLGEKQKLYPEFWNEITENIFTLEPSAANLSVSLTSGVVSDRKGASLSSFSDGKYASQSGSKTGDASTHGSEHHFSETRHFYGVDQPRNINFTKGLSHGSLFETHSKNSSETISLGVSDPHHFEAFLKEFGIKTDGRTKGSVTTITKTSELHHTKNGGTKSTGFHTVSHRTIDANNGDSESDFLNLERYSDFTSNLGQPIIRTDETSGSKKTVIHERTTQHHQAGFSKGFITSLDANPARLSDDETGDSDPSAYILHREQ